MNSPLKSQPSVQEEVKTIPAHDFPLPKMPSEEVLREICKDYDLSAAQQHRLTDFLQDLIYSQQHAKEHVSLKPKEINDTVTALGNDVTQLRKSLHKLTHDKRQTLSRIIAFSVAPFFSPLELSRRFHDFTLPSNDVIPPLFPESINDEYEIKSLHARTVFMKRNGIDALALLLEQIELSLSLHREVYLSSPSSSGGRKRHVLRDNVIANLLSLYIEFEGKISKASMGKHVDFCLDMFTALSLPTQGVARAIPAIVEKHKNHFQKT